MKISIIMPVYNAEKYLTQTLDSVCNQTFVDYELIAIDDGSKDSSLSILNQYKDKIKNMTVIANPNSGVSKTRNHGIDIAQGQYICFLDSDDLLHPQYLEKLYYKVNTDDVDISICGYQTFYNEIHFTQNQSHNMNKIDINNSVEMFDYVMDKGLGIQLWNKMYKSELLHKYNVKFNENSSYGEDMFFNWKIFLVSKNVYISDENLYGYRQNISAATMKYHDQLYEKYMIEYNDVREFALDNGIDEDLINKSIQINLLKRFISFLKMNIRRKDSLKNKIKYIQYLINEVDVLSALNIYKENKQLNYSKSEHQLFNAMINKDIVTILKISIIGEYRFRLSRIVNTYIRKIKGDK